jgi:CO/xanthine dehydrogenase FAD-binding subunit
VLYLTLQCQTSNNGNSFPQGENGVGELPTDTRHPSSEIGRLPVPVTARPTILAEAFDALDERPDAQLLAGGTDFMVEVNFGHRRPSAVVALRRVAELQGYQVRDSEVVIGAGTTWTVIERELADVVPALAAAARTVGSPQMRNAGTIGGNLGTGSPAGDGLPVLAAVDATVVLASRAGERELPLLEFVTGVKRTALRQGEIIARVRVPLLDGPQEFLKVGTRNAMVISICCAALAVDRASRSVRIGLGAVAPTPVRAPEAEQYIAGEIDWDSLTAPPEAVARFGELVRAAARPITDHRSSAVYRSHAVQVIATRALERSLAA